ncbi:MAG: TetR/AcrR family transcriptional regulator [Thermomicrobiales bacterium]|nr:TetR/AcrR family transcriptional regulator [Thermomicrobiales bacterium]
MAGQHNIADGRERLLNEARRLFLERGYGEVSMQEIASAAEMTKGAPYYHFRDKEDLFVQVFQREMANVTAEMSARLTEATNFRERLLAVVTLVAEKGRSNFGQLVTEYDRHVSADRRRRMKEECPPPTNELRAIFERAEADGELTRTSAQVAHAVFIAIIIGQTEIWKTEPELLEVVGWNTAASPEQIVDLFLHGV